MTRAEECPWLREWVLKDGVTGAVWWQGGDQLPMYHRLDTACIKPAVVATMEPCTLEELERLIAQEVASEERAATFETRHSRRILWLCENCLIRPAFAGEGDRIEDLKYRVTGQTCPVCFAEVSASGRCFCG